jgi:GNAT superfamily N-acetyltransferase
MKLTDYTEQADEFFQILPKDWQEQIVPYWNTYKQQTRVYVWLEGGQLIGGGLVFDNLSPDMEIHRNLLQKYLKPHMKYLGFIWINDSYRSQGLGKKWLQEIFVQHPQNGFWLSIEDENLKYFYSKLGFSVVEKLSHSDNEEWIMLKT